MISHRVIGSFALAVLFGAACARSNGVTASSGGTAQAAASVSIKVFTRDTTVLGPPAWVENGVISFGVSDSLREVSLRSHGLDRIDWRARAEPYLKVQPDGGTLAPNSSQTLQIALRRESLTTGWFVSSIAIEVTSTSGVKATTTVMASGLIPSPLEFLVSAVDDQLRVRLNGEEIATAAANLSWEPISSDRLRAGSNQLELSVINAATRTGGIELFGGSKREGWRYHVLLRAGSSILLEVAEEEDQPPVERWGTAFRVVTTDLVLNPETGAISLDRITCHVRQACRIR